MNTPRQEEAATRPVGRVKLVDAIEPPAPVEPLWKIDDLARFLNCSRREVERMRSAGRLPKPNLIVGRRSPRWRPETIRRWAEGGGK